MNNKRFRKLLRRDQSYAILARIVETRRRARTIAVNQMDGPDKIDFRKRLISAAAENHATILQGLLSRCAEIDFKDDRGWTLLHYAAFNGARKCVTLLINAGSNIGFRTDSGRSAADLAADAGHLDIVDVLTQEASRNTGKPRSNNLVK